MKLRHIAAPISAAAIALGMFAAPAAAQTDDFIGGAIAELDCGMLDTGLQSVGAYESDHAEDETTRAELHTNVRELSQGAFGDLVGGIPGAGLLQARYAGDIADRALECGLVAENPDLPFGSSQLFDNLPMLEALSSELN